MNDVDLNRFEFDYDTTWNAFFLDKNLNVYSRYGGRDEKAPEGRLSKESLLQTMREVLEVHRRRQREVSPRDHAMLQPVTTDELRPRNIPLLKKNHRGCVHCHQIREYRLLQTFHDGKFQRRQLFPFPLPENIGIVFDRKHGHRIERLLSTSLATESDLHVGDTIIRINDVPIHSEYDVRWALHRASDEGPIRIIARRSPDADNNLQTIQVFLKPTASWRETDLSWRKSQRSVPFPIGFRGYALTRSQRISEQINEDQLAIRVISILSRGLGKEIGLQKRDAIVSLGTLDKNRTFEQFKSDLLSSYKPGDEVVLTVRRAGKRIQLKTSFPKWFTAETTVP